MMPTKHEVVSSSSPSFSARKCTKPSTNEQKSKISLCRCSVCQEEIVEPNGKKVGQDAIYCDGACQAWLHRKCAGLPKDRFKLVSESNDPFYCPHCRLELQRDEISHLKVEVAELRSELTNLRNTLVTHSLPVEPTSDPTGSGDQSQPSPGSNPKLKLKLQSSADLQRKFNIVVYGLEESQTGTPKHARKLQDMQKAESVFTALDSSVICQSIRDCYRLGKYRPLHKRPRPVLIQLNRTSDVSEILAKRGSVKKPIVIKPDLSPEQRKCETTLMRKRWALIQSGVDRASIKIRQSKLYINNVIHGTASGVTYMVATNLPSVQSPPSFSTNNSEDTEQSSKSSSDRHPDPARTLPIPSQLNSTQLTTTASSPQFPPPTNMQSKPTQSYAAACSSQTSLATSSTTKTDPAPICTTVLTPAKHKNDSLRSV